MCNKGSREFNTKLNRSQSNLQFINAYSALNDRSKWFWFLLFRLRRYQGIPDLFDRKKWRFFSVVLQRISEECGCGIQSIWLIEPSIDIRSSYETPNHFRFLYHPMRIEEKKKHNLLPNCCGKTLYFVGRYAWSRKIARNHLLVKLMKKIKKKNAKRTNTGQRHLGVSQ